MTTKTSWNWGALVAGLTLGLAPGGAWAEGKAKPKPATPAKADTAAPEKTGVTASADTVRVTIRTVPPRAAAVRWGKKSLGPIPAPQALVVVRPRDSGPMDLVISTSGFLPVHTRAYTFSDNQVAVKLTPLSKKNTLFGYKEEPPPETENPDPNAPLAPAMGPPLPAPAPAPAPIPVTTPPTARKP